MSSPYQSRLYPLALIVLTSVMFIATLCVVIVSPEDTSAIIGVGVTFGVLLVLLVFDLATHNWTILEPTTSIQARDIVRNDRRLWDPLA